MNINPSNDITINFESLFFELLIGDAIVWSTLQININANILNIVHFIDAIAELAVAYTVSELLLSARFAIATKYSLNVLQTCTVVKTN